MTRVYLGLGTNRGERGENLRRALARLRRVVAIDALSSVYRSEPVGHRRQADFWNMVVRADTDLDPEPLLERLKGIERAMGRRATFPNAPRVIDLDILLYGDGVVRTPTLEVPHPRMLERGFVLRPLAELDPDRRHPVTGRTIAEHLRAAAPGLERTERLFPGERLEDGVVDGESSG
ncbi:MAG: 2-amino-4-hydroxy-6-hydroxymethyldihydropteridine diphosphokinase [Gemmatimonadota bacterium]